VVTEQLSHMGPFAASLFSSPTRAGAVAREITATNGCSFVGKNTNGRSASAKICPMVPPVAAESAQAVAEGFACQLILFSVAEEVNRPVQTHHLKHP